MKKIIIFFAIALIAVLGVGVSMARAATINVPGDYSTIQEAVSAATADDTIIVASGTYDVSSSYFGVRIDKPLTLQGENKETTIIQGGPNGIYMYGVDDVSITGFTIKGTTGISIWRGSDIDITDNNIEEANIGIFMYADNQIDILDNTITAMSGYTDRGIHIQTSSDIEIRGNTISGFTMGDVSGYLHGKAGAGIWISGGTSTYPCNQITIEENDITDNSFGIYAGANLATSSPTNIEVHNNNIEDNREYGVINIKYPDPRWRDPNDRSSGYWKYWDYKWFLPADSAIDATRNWWGTQVGNEIAEMISENVDYDPWLCGKAPTDWISEDGVCILSKAEILKESGVSGKGIDKAPGLQKEFNPKSQAAENAGKKNKDE